tara:strand:- start:1201 stop:1668 length:468 start_codon:yes stop_codon:yes gene_type:complete
MKNTILIALIFISILGCDKDKIFPDEPIIETLSFRIKGDTLGEWVFSFTDGDGDLGSEVDSDTNYFQKLHLRKPSNPLVDSVLVLSGERLPKINTSGIGKGIEGEITRFIELDLYDLQQGDTIYFSTYVVDQSGKRSNEIRTPRFTLNPTIFYPD